MLEEAQAGDSPENTQNPEDVVGGIRPESASTGVAFDKLALDIGAYRQVLAQQQPFPDQPRTRICVYTDGDVGGSGYNETRVDIVAVPCPGSDPGGDLDKGSSPRRLLRPPCPTQPPRGNQPWARAGR